MIRRYWMPLLIVALIVLSKLSGLLKDVMLTFYQGASSITDAFFLSTSITSLIYMGIYSAIPILVVPAYSRFKGNSPESSSAARVSSGVMLLVGASAALTLLVFATSDWLVRLVAPEADAAVQGLTARYLLIMAISFPISTAVGICNSLQSVDGKISPSYTVPIANNVFFCTGLALFGAGTDFYGVLIFSVLGWASLLVLNGARVKGSFPFSADVLSDRARVREISWIFLPAAFSFYIEQANAFVGTYFASTLPGHAISIWAYAGKLSMLFSSGFLVYLTTNIFPSIAALTVREDEEALAAYLSACVRIVALLALPTLAYFAFYAENIVSLLFGRGKFTPDDAAMVASILGVVLLAVPLGLVRDIMNRVYFAYSNTTVPLVMSAMALMLNFGFGFLLTSRIGLAGAAWGVVISVACHSVLLVLMVQKRSRQRLLLPMLGAIALCSIATGGAVLALEWMERNHPGYWLVNWLPFSFIYLGLAYLFGLRELRELRKGLMLVRL